MIVDIATLLRAFAEKEVEAIEKAGIKHAPTIGEMYEGLTANMLNQAIPQGLDLQVVSGFAEDGEGNISNQLDCMLVRGQGVQVPHTSKYKWHIKNIIAVIEVKKNMFSKELDESFHQLRKLLEAHSKWVQNFEGGEPVSIEPTRRAFSEITGIVAPQYEQLSQLPENIEYIYHTVLGDQFSPVRIALGYGGFSSEHGLRNGFIKFLNDKTLEHGYGPQAIPQLMVAQNASLVKFTGHPYCCSMNDDKMMLVASSSSNPILILLELIWTRLSYEHAMPELFGEDLTFEGFSPLLWAKLEKHPENSQLRGWGFTYNEVSKKDLENTPRSIDWAPTALTIEQFVIINQLCDGAIIDTSQQDFISFLTEAKQSVDEFISNIVATGLVARNREKLELTTTECKCAILPDGRYIAAEDNTGRLTRWVEKYMQDMDESMSTKPRSAFSSSDI